MSNSPKRGTKVKILQNAKVPARFRGKSGFISRINYTSERGYLYKIKIGDVFDPDSNESDLVASERDLIIFK